MSSLLLLGLLAFFPILHAEPTSDLPSTSSSFADPWDVNKPCEKIVKPLAEAQFTFAHCVLNYVRPEVCQKCSGHYNDYKKQVAILKAVKNTTLDGQPCWTAITDAYTVSGHQLIMSTLDDIWMKMSCDACFELNVTSEEYQPKPSTKEFLTKFDIFSTCTTAWRPSVVTDENPHPICNDCLHQFNDLFTYFWGIYTHPNLGTFCVDVVVAMNDTTHLWNKVWRCSSQKPDVIHNMLFIGTGVVLTVVTILFYASAYMQADERTRQLVHYSRLDEPVPERARLLFPSRTRT